MPVLFGFKQLAALPEERITDKISRRVLSGKQSMMVWWKIKAGAHAAAHKHPHEQIVWMLKGKMDFRIGDERRSMGAGDAAVIPSGVEHEGCLLYTSFFLLALLFAPLAGMVPAYATSAALLYVACVMARGLAEIDWEDITEYAPAVVTAITMPLTYSIATGIGLGFITYALAKVISGKFKEASPAVIVLAVLFAIKFAVSG